MHTRRKALTTGVVLAFVGVGAVTFVGRWFRNQPGRADSATIAESAGERDDAVVKREIAELRGEIAALSMRAALNMHTAGTGESSRPPTPPSPDPNQALTERHEATVRALAQRIVTETKDSAWSAKTEDLMRAAISPAQIEGSSLRSVTCATTLCAATISHQDLNGQQGFARSIIDKEPFASAEGVFYSRDPAAPLVTKIYVLRQGTDPVVDR